jgi:hypothetical protein
MRGHDLYRSTERNQPHTRSIDRNQVHINHYDSTIKFYKRETVNWVSYFVTLKIEPKTLKKKFSRFVHQYF